MFQDFNLLDTLTIAENISLSLIINKKNENKIDEMVNDIAKMLRKLAIRNAKRSIKDYLAR